MARRLRDDEIAISKWLELKVQCPICKNIFSNWYCPNCGLPKNNSSYGIYKDKIHHCGPNHFRCEFGTVSEYQMCSKCRTPNPYNANYCRSCGENIAKQAVDKTGHGWVDLGLSVLWSTETISGYYQWNNTKPLRENEMPNRSSYEKSEKKDVAIYLWGKKWRTPTKDETEELIKKCKWEKCIDSFNRNALKATGPNGNSIIIPTIGFINYAPRSNKETSCFFWTSSEFPEREQCAYAFHYTEWYQILENLINVFSYTRGSKTSEKIQANKSLHKAISFILELINNKLNPNSFLLTETQIQKLLEEARTNILYDKSDDLYEKLNTIRFILWRIDRQRAWLETPVIMSYNNDFPTFNMIGRTMKTNGLPIFPVADKKWLGKL